MNQNGNVALLPRECILLQESGFIGQDPYQTHVDFANSDVTFGRGGTQEEILLGFSPESCLVSLIADPLTGPCDSIVDILNLSQRSSLQITNVSSFRARPRSPTTVVMDWMLSLRPLSLVLRLSTGPSGLL
jgi:hypothetical protein